MDLFHEWLKDIDIDSKVIAAESNRLTNIILDGDFDIFQWGWYVEPDPDSMPQLLHLRPARRWSTPGTATRVRPAVQRAAQRDGPRRRVSEIVKQMQEMLYEACRTS